MFYMVEEGVDVGSYALVCHWSDLAGSKELDAVVAARDEVVVEKDGWVE